MAISLQKKTIVAMLAAFSFMALAMPFVASAAHSELHENVFSVDTLKGPLLICVGAPPGANAVSGSVSNVCQDLCDLVAQIAQIIYFLIAVVIWIVAPILVAVGGIMYMVAGANPGMVESAKKTLTGTVWGLAIILCAWLIVYSFVHAFGDLSSYVGGFGSRNGSSCIAPPAVYIPGSDQNTGGQCNGYCGGTCPGMCANPDEDCLSQVDSKGVTNYFCAPH